MKKTIFLFIILLQSVFAFSQTDSAAKQISLKAVEITDSSGIDKVLIYQPVSVSRMDETEIKRGQGILMDDAINANIPGVYMQRRTFSAGQQFNIRGYGNGTSGTRGVSSNFDGQGTKVYLNGIPVTDAEGITLMDDIDFGSIANVEVIKGPSGTLYGQAIAGVVNLRTQTAEPGKISIGQDIMAGSYGLQRYTTRLAIGKERASFLANYGKQLYSGKGFMDHTNSNKDFANLVGEFRPNDRVTVNTYFGFSRSYDARNGEITKEAWDTLNYTGNSRYLKNDAHSNVMSFRAGVGYTYKIDKYVSTSTSVFGTGLISNVSSAAGWTDKNSINYGLRKTIDMSFGLGKGFSLAGTLGTELQMQNAQTQGFTMVADSNNLSGYNIIGPQRSNQYTISRTASAFTEWTLAMPYDFSLTAGFGWSGLGIELNDRFYVATNNNPSNPNGTHNPTQYKNKFMKMFSPHVAINKVIIKQLSVYASFSRGYKAPVSSYFFVPSTGEVLTGLKPELGTQFEIGSKGSVLKNRFSYQLALFYTMYTDKMTTVAVPDSTNTATSYSYVVNAGKQNNLGVELAISAVAYQSDRFVKAITPFVNLTYSYFRYGNFQFQKLSSDKKHTDITDYTGKVVAGAPPVTFNAGFDFTTKPGLYLNMTYSFRDKMYYTSDNLNQTNFYHLLNAKIGYSHVFIKHIGIDAYVGFNNITQNQNYAMVFVNQIPDAYLPAPNKANYYGGINLKYIF